MYSQPEFTCSKSTIEALEKGAEICSKLAIKTQRRHSLSILLTLNIFHTFSSVSIVDFEQVNASWDHVKYFLVLAEKSFLIFRVSF